MHNLIAGTKGVWRLPENSAVPFFRHERGLPQGMSVSVTFSELMVSLLIWRLHALSVVCTVTYVDDVNIVASSEEQLTRAWHALQEYVRALSLHLSGDKSYLWGTESKRLEELAKEWGIQKKNVLATLGMEWGLCVEAKPEYAKEKERIRKAVSRLKRLAHLQAPIGVKVDVIVTGVLSLVAFSPLPDLSLLQPLRMLTRKAINQNFGAPESLFHVLTSTSLDPALTWAIASLRLWIEWVRAKRDMPKTPSRPVKKLSRLASYYAWIRRQGWMITWESISGEGMTLRFDEEWRHVRTTFVNIFRARMARTLAERRPNTFAGLTCFFSKHHRKFLATLPSHSASILVRVWTGSPMTAYMRSRMNEEESPKCACGSEKQDLPHLMYDCVLMGEVPIELHAWKSLPAAQSCAILLHDTSAESVRLWKVACKRAISVLSNLPRQEEVFDWKGHCVVPDSSGSYAYCVWCLVTRKISDNKHIAARPCRGQLFPSECIEGHYYRMKGHTFRLMFKNWKRSARRPSFTCSLCGVWAWAGAVLACSTCKARSPA